MNKIVKLMCLLALVAVVGTSCKKTEKVQSFQATLGEVTVDGDEKMAIEGESKVVFEAGDPLVLYNVNEEDPEQSIYGTYHAAGNGVTTTFVADEPMDNTTMMDAFFGYYPGNLCQANLDHNNNCYFKLERTQDYRANMIATNGLYAACKDSNHQELGDANFTFRLIGGVMKLRLYTTTGKKVQSITVTDRDLYLTGFVSMNIAKVDPVELTYLVENYNETNTNFMARLADYIQEVDYRVCYNSAVEETEIAGFEVPTQSVTLQMPEGGVSLGSTSGTAKTFYIGLRPLALYKGFDVTVTYTDGTTYEFGTSKDNKIRPSKIRSFSPIQVY